jgi:hypothetical protein
LGDKRLNKRCEKLLESFGCHPDQSIPVACGGWDETMAAYRFFSNKSVTHEKILEPHKESTIKRMQREKVVLLAQDTTEVNYTGRKKIEGLGFLQGEYQQGFYMHPMLAVTPEKVCLGVVDNYIWTRSSLGKRNKSRWKDIKDKESYCWLRGYNVANEVARSMPGTMLVTVGDRESDIYELFAEGLKEENRAYWIVRSQHNRNLVKSCGKAKDKLREEILNLPVISEAEFYLATNKKRKGRLVKQEIRIGKVKLKAPRKKNRILEDAEINVVFCCEKGAPVGEKPIEWLLLTNVPIDSKERAEEIVQWYVCRWQIEVYFRTLKSGCLIEELQLEDGERIKACLGLYMIVAWRIMYVTMVGRICPDISSEVIFTKAEWQAAYVATKKKSPPKESPPLNEMIKMVGQLGGYLNRKGDGEPGAQAIWIGIQRLRDIAFGWQISQEANGKRYV